MVSSTTVYIEVWVRLITPGKSRIQVILDREDDPEFDDEWLTSDERLNFFIKARENIVRRFKGSYLTYVQGDQSSEE